MTTLYTNHSVAILDTLISVRASTVGNCCRNIWGVMAWWHGSSRPKVYIMLPRVMKVQLFEYQCHKPFLIYPMETVPIITGIQFCFPLRASSDHWGYSYLAPSLHIHTGYIDYWQCAYDDVLSRHLLSSVGRNRGYSSNLWLPLRAFIPPLLSKSADRNSVNSTPGIGIWIRSLHLEYRSMKSGANRDGTSSSSIQDNSSIWSIYEYIHTYSSSLGSADHLTRSEIIMDHPTISCVRRHVRMEIESAFESREWIQWSIMRLFSAPRPLELKLCLNF